jgi:predicted nucleotidyltransferase
MTRDEVLRILRGDWAHLRQEFGVRSLSIFGSVARNEATDDSDVDLLVEFESRTGYFGLVRLQIYLQKLLGRGVDLGTAGGLRPAVRQTVAKEAIRVA